MSNIKSIDPVRDADNIALAKKCAQLNTDGKIDRFINALLADDTQTLKQMWLELYKQSDHKEEIMRHIKALELREARAV